MERPRNRTESGDARTEPQSGNICGLQELNNLNQAKEFGWGILPGYKRATFVEAVREP